jgi:hypothetical protein
VARTATARLFPAAAALLLACGGDGSGPTLATERIDYLDGAIEPILVRGERFIIEGFGFGTVRGAVRLGVTEAAVAESGWTDHAITATVPASAVSGTLHLITADGRPLSATVHVLPPPPLADADSLMWQARAPLTRAPAGVALAAAEFPTGTTLRTTLYAAGGAEPFSSGGQLLMAPDSGVYVAHALDAGGGAISGWVRQRDTSDAARSRVLPVPRAFAAAAVATRYNSRLPGSRLYVIGGVDAAGRAQATVLGADVTADSVSRPFSLLEPLPAPVAGAIAIVRRGRVYVIGGTDAQGRPSRNVYVGRIGADGHIDGWYQQPPLPAPRAYGGGLVRDGRVVTVGGVADSVPPGGGVDPSPQRLVTSDTAPVSVLSGFFTGPWGAGPALLPEGRSQFALLDLGTLVLVVGGMYAGAQANDAETLAAAVAGDSIGPFTGPAGANRIADQTCGVEGAGTLIGPAGVTWREGGGRYRGLVAGGVDLGTEGRRTCTWGF